jgi:YVTN family beta-propeller protein
VAPDGTVYVANLSDGTVSVIMGDRVTTTINVGKNPGGIVVAPDGTVYVTHSGDGTVSVLR